MDAVGGRYSGQQLAARQSTTTTTVVGCYCPSSRPRGEPQLVKMGRFEMRLRPQPGLAHTFLVLSRWRSNVRLPEKQAKTARSLPQKRDSGKAQLQWIIKNKLKS
jgi:hypothetical protein